jgi:hypothetical protein
MSYQKPSSGAVTSVASKTGVVTLASTDLTDGAALNTSVTANTTNVAARAKRLVPTAVKTAAYTLAANDLVLVDASAGTVPITVPASLAAGTVWGVKVVNLGTGYTVPVTLSGSETFNRASGGTSTLLAVNGHDINVEVQAGGVHLIESSDVPLAQTDLRYGRANIAGGRQLAASRVSSVMGSSSQSPQNGPRTDATSHFTPTGGTDWRLQYGAMLASELDGPTNSWTVKVGFEYPAQRTDSVTTVSGNANVTDASITDADYGRPISGTGIPVPAFVGTIASGGGGFVLSSVQANQTNVNATASGTVTATLSAVVTPVTFAGKQTALIDPGGTSPVCDPVPVDVPAGATFRLRAFTSTLWGSFKTVATATNVGDTAIVLNAAPATPFLNALPQVITVGAEQVTCTAFNLSTLTLTVTALAAAHAVSVLVGQQTPTSGVFYGDQGAGSNSSATDNSWTATAIAALSGGQTTTMTAASSIGDRLIKIASPLNGLGLTVDTGGTPEAVTVVNVVGEANPYTVYLSAPLASAHSSGATVSTVTTVGFQYAPTTITCDRPNAGALPPVFLGPCDSIVNGVGYNARAGQSYLKDALDAAGRLYIDGSRSGEALNQWVSPYNARRRKSLQTVCGWAYHQEATNDLFGRTQAQIQANIQTAVNTSHAKGLKVALQTVMPRTTSSDSWATVANQTVTAAESVRLAINALIMSNAFGADMIVPAHSAIDSGLVAAGAETGKWLAADPTNGPYTGSGLHPSLLGHLLVKTWLTTNGYIAKMS